MTEKEQEAAGILDPKIIRSAAAQLLTDHLKNYLADLEKRNRAGRDGRGAKKLKTRITTLLTECQWKLAFHVFTT
jgi:hypothetical protein